MSNTKWIFKRHQELQANLQVDIKKMMDEFVDEHGLRCREAGYRQAICDIEDIENIQFFIA